MKHPGIVRNLLFSKVCNMVNERERERETDSQTGRRTEGETESETDKIYKF